MAEHPMTAPAPSPAEQAVIERFGIFDEERKAATAVDVDALDALAAVLDDTATGLWMGQHGPGWGRVIAAALLPVVDRIANQRAAAELRAMARDIRYTTVLGHIAERLDVRADALDPS